MTVAAVPGPATSHEDFSPADLVLPSLEALPKVLERNGNGHGHSRAATPPAAGATLMSLGEPNVKRALGLDPRHASPTTRTPSAGKLIDEASRQFDLTPLEADFLYRQLTETLKKKPPCQPPS